MCGWNCLTGVWLGLSDRCLAGTLRILARELNLSLNSKTELAKCELIKCTFSSDKLKEKQEKLAFNKRLNEIYNQKRTTLEAENNQSEAKTLPTNIRNQPELNILATEHTSNLNNAKDSEPGGEKPKNPNNGIKETPKKKMIQQVSQTPKRKRETEIINQDLGKTPKSPKLDNRINVNKPTAGIKSKILFHESEIMRHTPNSKLKSRNKTIVAQKKPPDKP